MRCRTSLGLLVCTLALAGCHSGEEATDKQKALKAYTACLYEAASQRDDGTSDIAAIAAAIAPACSADFRNVIRVNDPQGRKEFETAMHVKELDFAKTVVRDRRQDRSRN